MYAHRVKTLGPADYDSEYTKSYELQYRLAVGSWQTLTLTGNSAADEVQVNVLSNPINARYLRFKPLTWKTHPALRVEAFGNLGIILSNNTCTHVLSLHYFI